jgi:hypothetical protein
MKRLFKSAVAALAVLLTVLPAVAGLTCGAMPLVAFGHESEMPMSALGAECPMHHGHHAGTGCLQECCRNGWPQAIVHPASKAKPKTGGMQSPLAVPGPLADVPSYFATATREEIAATGPPRHVLLKVFRI